MKKGLLILLLISSLARAQDYSLSEAMDGLGTDIELLGHIDSLYYFKNSTYLGDRATLKTIGIQIWNFNSKEVIDYKIKLEHESHKLQYLGLKLINNKLAIFSGFWNQKRHKYYLFVGEYKQNEEPIEWRYITEIEHKARPVARKNYSKRGGFTAIPNDDFFHISTSLDNSKVAVCFTNRENKKSLFKPVNLTVLDSSFKILYSVKDSIFNTDIFNVVDELLINNNGDAYIKTTKYVSKVAFGGAYLYRKNISIIRASNKTKKTHHYPIAIDNKYILNCALNIMDNGSLLIGGNYSDVGISTMKGSFISILENGELNIVTTKDYSNEIINKYPADYGFIKKGVNELRVLKAQFVEYDSDGYYVGNQVITQTFNFFTVSYKVPYYYEFEFGIYSVSDILIHKISANTNDEYIVYVKPFNGPIKYSLYSYLFKESVFTFVYNIPLKKNNVFFELVNGNTVITKMKSDGELLYNEIIKGTSNVSPIIGKANKYNYEIVIPNRVTDVKSQRLLIVK